MKAGTVHIVRKLWGMSYSSGGEFDYSEFDLDKARPAGCRQRRGHQP
jgi:hypothetical protein